MANRGIRIRGPWLLPLAFTAASVAACSCGLGEDEARKLIEASFVDARGAKCQWWPPERKDGGWVFLDFDEYGLCASELEKAGLIKRGRCVDGREERCAARAVEALGIARFDEQGVSFPCGELEFVNIRSIKEEEEGTVLVTYGREFTDAPIMKQLGNCSATILLKPDAGRLERWRRFKRRQDGSWALHDFDSNYTTVY